MNSIQEYILSLIGGALVCGVILSMVPKGQFHGVMKLLCGLFLTVSLLYPITNFDWSALAADWTIAEFENGEAVAAMGKVYSEDLLASRIKQEAEEYILDKAAVLGLSVTVEVRVSDSDIPVPESVRLSGTAAQDSRQRLTQIITEDLGISKENQLWTEGNSAKN